MYQYINNSIILQGTACFIPIQVQIVFLSRQIHIEMQILTYVNTPSDYGPSDLKSPPVVSFTLTRKDIHTETVLCSTAFVYQRLNSDPTKRGARLHKVFQSFHSIGFPSRYFFTDGA